VATVEVGLPPTVRERLLDAAIAVFLERGFWGTRVQDIARAAGLSTGALYSQFDSKSALLAEAVATHGEFALVALVRAAGADDQSGAARAARLGSMLSTAATPLDTLLLDAFAAASHEPDAARRVGPRLDELHDAVSERVAAMRSDEELSDAATDTAVTALVEAVILGTVVMRATRMPLAGVDESAQLMRHLLRSLGSDRREET
jgi:TetR/AcrR family transcriptional repressor of uid operon